MVHATIKHIVKLSLHFIVFISNSNNKNMCMNCLKDSYKVKDGVDWSLLVIRIGLAIFFISHGWSKLAGMDGFIDMMTMWNFPAPVVLGWAVALTEFVGGIAVLLGVFTKVAAWGFALIALVAYVQVKKFALGMGMDGGDLDILSFALAIPLILLGPGKFGLMGMKHPGMCPCPKCTAGK